MGFALSLIFAHAPVVLPEIAGVRLRHHAGWWVPLGLLHGSLVVRIAADLLGSAVWRQGGAALNAAAVVAFAVNAIASRESGDRG